MKLTLSLTRMLLCLSLPLLGQPLVHAAEPPEVEKLKGLHIPPITKWKTSGGIPGWKHLGSATVSIHNIYRKTDPELGYKIITRGSLAAFVITKHYPDLSYTIMDARAIPISRVHHLTEICEREHSPRDTKIMALAIPEKYQEETHRIIRAWQVDLRTGAIQDIPTKGVVCNFPGSGD